MSGPFDSDEPIPGMTSMAERLAARYKAGGLREFENGSGWFTCRDCGCAVRHGYLLGHDVMHDLLDAMEERLSPATASEAPEVLESEPDTPTGTRDSDHLPECPMNDLDHLGRPLVGACICDRLRQAEQRVLREAPVSVFVKAFTDGKDVGWEQGVQAARDAVDGIGGEPQPRHMGDPLAWSEGYTFAIGEALAAIDACGVRNE